MANNPTLPLTGTTGDATVKVAAEDVSGVYYQYLKLTDGASGSTNMVVGGSSHPASTAFGLVVRNIPGAAQALATGTTGIMGAFQLATGTTGVVGSVNVTSGSVLGPSTALIGTVAQGSAGSSASPWWVTSTGAPGSTTVDANLTSAGSTKVIGTVGVSSGVVLGVSTAAIGLVSSGAQTIGSVQLTSAGTTGSIGSVALLAGSTANSIGSVALVAGTTANALGSVALLAGTTANTLGSAALLAGSTANAIGSVALLGSTNAVGNVGLTTAGGAGLVGLVDGLRFTAGAITTVNSSIDAVCLASNANRRGAIIQNHSTGTALLVNLSTVAVSSAAAYNLQVAANAFIAIGGQTGNIPLYTGAIRCKMNSTLVAGPVFVTEFTS